MIDLVKHQKQCGTYLEGFGSIQRSMVDMKLQMAQQGFQEFYVEAEVYFEGISDFVSDAKKSDRFFLLKQQTALILKNIKSLRIENEQLTELKEKEIIRHFEKQLVFKKILKRQFAKSLAD